MWERKYLERHSHKCLILATFALALSSYIEQVSSMPTILGTENAWPSFQKRNIGALAREGFLRSAINGYKRSISTLAKNGQLPTFRAPFDGVDNKDDDDDSESSESKRNVAAIARLRSYSAVKRNIQALARDGYRFGKTNYNQSPEKRNLASLARAGYIHKRDEIKGNEYYLPFFQNSVPPLSELDGPLDYNEIYDYQQSLHPDLLAPLAQPLKRSADGGDIPEEEMYYQLADKYSGDNYKRGVSGLPVHGLIRPTYVDPNARSKRYILTMPDAIDKNDVADEEPEDNDKRSVDYESVMRENFEKRHIGSLARLGLLPSFRFSGGRYSRSGRARLLFPSQEMYRKHSHDENLGIRQYIPSTETDPAADSDDPDVPATALPSHSHPTGRILHRPLNNDIPEYLPSHPAPSPPLPLPNNYIESLNKNRWQSNKEVPKFYYFRSLKVPYHQSGKRYLLLPAVDNILLRKNYPNSSLPSRRKNQ